MISKLIFKLQQNWHGHLQNSTVNAFLVPFVIRLGVNNISVCFIRSVLELYPLQSHVAFEARHDRRRSAGCHMGRHVCGCRLLWQQNWVKKCEAKRHGWHFQFILAYPSSSTIRTWSKKKTFGPHLLHLIESNVNSLEQRWEKLPWSCGSIFSWLDWAVFCVFLQDSPHDHGRKDWNAFLIQAAGQFSWEMWTEWHPLKVESWTCMNMFQELISTLCHALFWYRQNRPKVVRTARPVAFVGGAVGSFTVYRCILWPCQCAVTDLIGRQAAKTGPDLPFEWPLPQDWRGWMRCWTYGILSRTCLICFDYLIRIKVYQESSNPKHAWCDPQENHRHRCLEGIDFFPKQFTVGVLNATLNLAALVLVGVAAFLGSEVVLAPFGSLHVRCERKNERKKNTSSTPSNKYLTKPHISIWICLDCLGSTLV